jgi:hypothetical protein
MWFVNRSLNVSFDENSTRERREDGQEARAHD